MGAMADMFKNTFGGLAHDKGGTTQAVQHTNNPGLSVPNPTAAPAPGPANNSAAPAPTEAPGPGSSLDKFKNFWDTPKDDKGNPIVKSNVLAEPLFTLDPTKIREQAAGLSFTADIKPETLDALVVDGKLDTTKLLEIINQTQQSGFAAAIQAMGGMVNSATTTNNTNLTATLSEHIRRTQLKDTPIDNPVLQHPAAQPLVNALRTTAFSRNPNANPADVAKSVDDLLIGLATALAETTPERVKAKEVAAANATDWDKIVSGGAR